MFDIQKIYVFIYFSITIYIIMWGGGWMLKVLGYDWGGEFSNPTLGTSWSWHHHDNKSWVC
jgi:hypothetical protein